MLQQIILFSVIINIENSFKIIQKYLGRLFIHVKADLGDRFEANGGHITSGPSYQGVQYQVNKIDVTQHRIVPSPPWERS